jgi:hypothetical protein
MADAEMVIRLIDATVEEQAALDNTPTFNNGGPVPPPVQKTDAAKSTEANARDGRTTEVPTSRWTEGLHRLRDALLSVSERFAPKAFQEPIERLINALTPKDERGNTTVPPPVQTDVESKPLVDHIKPTIEPEKEEKRSHGRTKEHHENWIEGFLKKSHFGREFLETYEKANRNLTKGVEVAKPITKKAATATKKVATVFSQTKLGQKLTSFGNAATSAASKVGQKASGFAKATVSTVAKKLGFPVASGAAVTGSASNAGSSAAAAGAGAAEGAAGGTGLAALANPVGLTVAAVAASFAAVAVSAKALSEVFESEAERLTQYSGTLSAVQAHHQMNTELNMLDRARKTEDGLAKFDTARGNLNSQMEKLWTQVLSILLKMEPAMTTGVNALTVMAAEVQRTLAAAEGVLATQKAIAAAMTPDKQDDIDAANAIWQAAMNMNDAMKSQKAAWEELIGRSSHGHGHGIDRMLQAVLDTELDAQGNVKKKHGGAHGGHP